MWGAVRGLIFIYSTGLALAVFLGSNGGSTEDLCKSVSVGTGVAQMHRLCSPAARLACNLLFI